MENKKGKRVPLVIKEMFEKKW